MDQLQRALLVKQLRLEAKAPGNEQPWYNNDQSALRYIPGPYNEDSTPVSGRSRVRKRQGARPRVRTPRWKRRRADDLNYILHDG